VALALDSLDFGNKPWVCRKSEGKRGGQDRNQGKGDVGQAVAADGGKTGNYVLCCRAFTSLVGVRRVYSSECDIGYRRQLQSERCVRTDRRMNRTRWSELTYQDQAEHNCHNIGQTPVHV